MQSNKEKIVYTKWVANALIKKGHIPIRVEKNPKKPNQTHKYSITNIEAV